MSGNQIRGGIASVDSLSVETTLATFRALLPGQGSCAGRHLEDPHHPVQDPVDPARLRLDPRDHEQLAVQAPQPGRRRPGELRPLQQAERLRRVDGVLGNVDRARLAVLRAGLHRELRRLPAHARPRPQAELRQQDRRPLLRPHPAAQRKIRSGGPPQRGASPEGPVHPRVGPDSAQPHVPEVPELLEGQVPDVHTRLQPGRERIAAPGSHAHRCPLQHSGVHQELVELVDEAGLLGPGRLADGLLLQLRAELLVGHQVRLRGRQDIAAPTFSLVHVESTHDPAVVAQSARRQIGMGHVASPPAEGLDRHHRLVVEIDRRAIGDRPVLQ